MKSIIYSLAFFMAASLLQPTRGSSRVPQPPEKGQEGRPSVVRRGNPSLLRPSPATPEEREFSTALANEVSRALVVIASEPDRTFPRGSLAHRMKPTYDRIVQGERAVAAKSRAEAILKADLDTRQRYFGTSGKVGGDAHRVSTQQVAQSEELKTKLRAALWSRLNANDARLRQASVALQSRKLSATKTKVETGHFTGDILTNPTTSALVTSPDILEFRWSTTEPGAEYGRWTLLTIGASPQDQTLLASGEAGLPGAIFKIDLKNWLPSQPPASGAKQYEVRVGAYRTKKVGGQQQVAGGAPPKGVSVQLGTLSEPVAITYARSATTPLKFAGADVFSTLDFSVGNLTLMQSQSGGGTEEFRVAGFIAETRGKGGSTTHKFDSFEKKLSSKHPVADLAWGADFTLPDPDDDSWPRVYTLFLSTVEVDSGGSVAEWLDSTFTTVREIVIQWAQGIMEEIIDELKAQGEIALLAVIGGGGAGAAAILSATSAQIAAYLASVATGVVVAAVVVAVVVVACAIIEAIADDSYGVATDVVILPSNLVEFYGHVPGKWLENKTKFEIWGTAAGGAGFNEQDPWPAAVGGSVAIDWQFLLKGRRFWFAN